MNRSKFRSQVLAHYGASGAAVEALLAYNENVFDHSRLVFPLQLPLAPEPHVAAWEGYAAEAREDGVLPALRRRLVQLRFPIQDGISQTEAYRAATRRGVPADNIAEATGLVLNQPESLHLLIYHSLGGPIPVLIAADRSDFVALVRALSKRNEPVPIADSLGASMITGLNNWDRIRQHRQQWELDNPANHSETDWGMYFRELVSRKELYQDRVIILSAGPYSGVTAQEIGLDDEEWRTTSLAIRLEHECTHFFTLRLCTSMRNNLLDELIADYAGIVAAAGCYRADWFLRFVGLEAFPAYREGGRLENYRGQPPLSNEAFRVMQALAKAAAENVERFVASHADSVADLGGRARMLIALTYMTIEELACEHASRLLEETLARFGDITVRPTPNSRLILPM